MLGQMEDLSPFARKCSQVPRTSDILSSVSLPLLFSISVSIREDLGEGLRSRKRNLPSSKSCLIGKFKFDFFC